MPDFKGIAKGGWNPKGKDGKSKESWRGDFKGVNQVAGWLGKGKGSNTDSEEHISRPLSSLKDPAAFGPPPKHVNYHGGAALPNQITPDTSGLGAPLSKAQIQAQREQEEESQRKSEEETRPLPPPRQYRADTTGLSTANLPPPPGRKDGADGRSLISSPSPVGSKAKTPGLPPRLPPRQNSNPPQSPPPVYSSSTQAEILNRGSVNRLGASGISVPDFGIGRQPTTEDTNALSPTTNASQLNELQSRFSRMSQTSPNTESSREGTTFAQKQAALKTASSFRNDPSSVSFSDARNAASTANNFKERHSDQVKSGWQSANRLNDKYGISNKVGTFNGSAVSQTSEPGSHQIELRDNTPGTQEPGVLGKKKPPPPPSKKPQLSSVVRDNGPPPIPLASKPKPPVRGSFSD